MKKRGKLGQVGSHRLDVNEICQQGRKQNVTLYCTAMVELLQSKTNSH